MKRITLIFALSITLIAAVAAYNFYNHSDHDQNHYTIARTIVHTNPDNLITSKITMTLQNDKWIESTKVEYNYNGNQIEEIRFESHNGNWEKTKKIVRELNDAKALISKTTYTYNQSNTWETDTEEQFTDLSLDNNLLHDMVFDKNGNLIMDATYNWSEGLSNGITKEEYTYEKDGKPNQTISYVWSSNEWVKDEVSDMLYE
ncbi:MAG: hypothetical protein J6Y82_05000 [Bacteroidales bacterium]|nr:hypothetical protein [Bacteroidales bacterium]